MKKSNSRLVYSSDKGRVCPKCEKYFEHCSCKQSRQQSVPPAKSDGTVRVSRETKGRKGKGVSIVTGVPLAGGELKKLAKELKQKCGTGGTVKDGAIEIQGDHRDTLVELLKTKGWTVKIAGG
jgi:translation initiation factor 1